MPQATSPFILSDVSLTLKLAAGTAQEHMCQLNQAQLTPSAAASGSEFETFCNTFAPPTKAASWVLDLVGFQAYSDASDLALFLFDNELAEADFVLTPNGGTISATNPGFSGKVILSPGAIGGTANQYAQFTVSLVVKGKPTKLVTPPAAEPEAAEAEELDEVAA